MIKKILIVDDSIVARMGMRNAIPKDHLYELYEAADGFAGVEEFKKAKPDVTFLDLTMPVMTGFQALEEIKKIDKDAIVFVVTADIQTQTIETVMKLGACMVLKKPATKEDIRNALQKASELKEGLAKP